jgi:hypothetical protein
MCAAAALTPERYGMAPRPRIMRWPCALPLASLAGRRQRVRPDDQTLVAQARDAEWAVAVLGNGLQELDALGCAYCRTLRFC